MLLKLENPLYDCKHKEFGTNWDIYIYIFIFIFIYLYLYSKIGSMEHEDNY